MDIAPFGLEERLVRIARQAQFAAAEMGEGQLGIKAHMHRSEMDVAPGALDRMRSGEDGGTTGADAHSDSPHF